MFDRVASLLTGHWKKVVGTLCALGLSACDSVPVTSMGSGLFGGSRVDVALLVPYGSAAATDTKIAQDLENAARLAIADQPDARLNLTVYPTGGTAGQASSAAQLAIAEGADVIVGPLYAEAANAAALASAARGVNVLAFSNNSTIAGGNLFILGATFENTAQRLMSYSRRQGLSSTLVVHAEGLAGELGRDAILRAAALNGMQVAGVESYGFSEEGVRTAANAIAGRVNATGADTVFLTAGPESDLPFLADRLPNAGLETGTTQLLGLSRWDSAPQVLAFPALDGGLFALPDSRLTSAFVSRYQGAYGAAPHPLAGLAYDALAAVGALQQTGGQDPVGAASLTRPNGFAGTTGIFRLRTDGTNQRALAIAKVQNNQVVVIEPAPTTFGGTGL